MSKPRIAFITGGTSPESEISYKSATTIENNIDREKYQVSRIDIRPDGWWYTDTDGTEKQVDKNDFSIQQGDEKINFDAALIGIHGTPGEDGRLQGYLDMVNVPYGTCGHTTSAITFNKRYAVAVAAFSGIRVGKSFHFFKTDHVDFRNLADSLKFPVFVKPANGGSSIGMSKVPDATGLPGAFDKAFEQDDQVLVEEEIAGREFTIGVFRKDGEIIALPMTEVKSLNYFFDFEAKYQGKNIETTPAEVDDHRAEKIRDAARRIYAIFNCNGVIRIDFIYNDEVDEPFMLEINTIPGQSEASLVPLQVQLFGMTLTEFYGSLIEDALKRKK